MSRMSRTQCAPKRGKDNGAEDGRGDGTEECWHPLRRASRSIQKRGVNVTHFEIRWNLIQRTLIFTALFSSSVKQRFLLFNITGWYSFLLE